MKRIFYVLGPLVFTLLVIVAVAMGHKEGLMSIYNATYWRNFVEPRIWHDALTQALWSSQIAGGYLVSAGSTVYSNIDVHWTALILVSANIVASWLGTILWFAIIDPTLKDSSGLSLLVQAHFTTHNRGLPIEWSMVLFVTIFISGIISMIILLYPIYDRFNRIGGRRWRFVSFASSFVGWKSVVEDVEFLCGDKMKKIWVLGWCATPGIIIPFLVWWMVKIIIEDYTSWESIAMLTSAGFAIITFFLFALFTVLRQEQYDCFSKFLASFKPSRHWGPRDPITHYYWLTRREEDRGTAVRSRYHGRYLNQLQELSATDPNYDSLGNPIGKVNAKQQRTNSDDLVFTIYRRQYMKDQYDDIFDIQKQRPKSLDWDVPAKLSERDFKYRDSTLGTRKLSMVQIKKVVPVKVRRISLEPR
ncbi:sodium-dependent nutrient amino acid transporter 1-like [Hyposmocoma kahamanoa]|uniref:sodium-dependent nutrient amino acid transporter 1-like n=1 Tax=Hyposmocoma kahamanoa TaxID=1477025 RepID=UPI000E6D79C3|nr:sodium-dependent nutrient amino acid transporter 1-like [Hyposmocoma kahamanoa]